jgi:hypothetical protein
MAGYELLDERTRPYWYRAGLELRQQATGLTDDVAAGAERVSRTEEANMDLDPAERFLVEGLHYHPQHPAFYVQLLGDTLFFPARARGALTMGEFPEGRWVTVTDGDGVNRPIVALRRDGSTVSAAWL